MKNNKELKRRPRSWEESASLSLTMGGEAQRRRAKNVLKARETKSGRLTTLPPPPDAVTGRNGKKAASDDMPRTLQKMLRLKEALASGGKKRVPVSGARHPVSAHAPARLRDGAAAAAPQQASLPAGLEQVPSVNGDRSQQSGRPAEVCTPSQTEGVHSQSEGRQAAAPQQRLLAGTKQRAVAPLPATGGMKQRKKDFLRRRKLKKRGRSSAAGDGEEAEGLEAQLMHDAHKPKFGEQAMAPLKVNLKRKHFVPNESQSRSSKRCTAIFEQQMAAAQAAGARQQGSAVQVARPGGAAQRAKQQKIPACNTVPDIPEKKQASGGASRRSAVQAGLQAAVIRAYRGMRREEDGKGATMQTLKALVKRDAGRAAAMSQGE